MVNNERANALHNMTVSRLVAANALASYLRGEVGWERVLQAREARGKAAAEWGQAWRRNQEGRRMPWHPGER